MPNDPESVSILSHLTSVIAEKDQQYAQRFEAQQQAINAALMAQKEAINAALVAQKEAVIKAEVATEKRFEGVNEFRQTLGDQQRMFITRTEVDINLKSLNEKVGLIQSQMERLQSERAGVKGGWGYAVGLIGFILAITSLMAVFIRFKP